MSIINKAQSNIKSVRVALDRVETFTNSSIYVKNIASPLDKLTNNIVNRVVSGMPGNANGLASSITKSLFDIGSSYDSIQAIASIKTDNIISKGSADYFTVAANALGKSSISNIANSRVSTREYFSSVSPNAKISRAEQQFESIITAII
jgi:hypothetical protein